MMTEGEALILQKNFIKIVLTNKIENNGSEEFILITKFYNNPNEAAISF